MGIALVAQSHVTVVGANLRRKAVISAFERPLASAKGKRGKKKKKEESKLVFVVLNFNSSGISIFPRVRAQEVFRFL